MKTTLLTLVLAGAVAGGAAAQQPAAEAKPADPKVDKLALEDQFGRKQDLATFRGDVVVLVYGDRRANEACREFGEKLHVLFHPTAAGLPAAKARTAPVAPLAGVAAGSRSPDVFIVPVAAAGKVPGVVKDLIRSQVKSACPDVPVWLDFAGTMEQNYGLRAGQPNVVVFDAAGRVRLKIAGTPDQAANEKLLQTVQNLRAEAAGLAGK